VNAVRFWSNEKRSFFLSFQQCGRIGAFDSSEPQALVIVRNVLLRDRLFRVFQQLVKGQQRVTVPEQLAAEPQPQFNVPFQHKYGYITDERSRVGSYPYPVNEGQRYINLNPGRPFVQQPPKTKKGSRSSFKLSYVHTYIQIYIAPKS